MTKTELEAEIKRLKFTINEQGFELMALRHRLSVAERNGPVGVTLPLFAKGRPTRRNWREDAAQEVLRREP